MFLTRPSYLPHERGRVLERGIAQPRPLALDDGGGQHRHDVRREAGYAAGHSQQHPSRAFVVTSTNHFLHLMDGWMDGWVGGWMDCLFCSFCFRF